MKKNITLIILVIGCIIMIIFFVFFSIILIKGSYNGLVKKEDSTFITIVYVVSIGLIGYLSSLINKRIEERNEEIRIKERNEEIKIQERNKEIKIQEYQKYHSEIYQKFIQCNPSLSSNQILELFPFAIQYMNIENDFNIFKKFTECLPSLSPYQILELFPTAIQYMNEGYDFEILHQKEERGTRKDYNVNYRDAMYEDSEGYGQYNRVEFHNPYILEIRKTKKIG